MKAPLRANPSSLHRPSGAALVVFLLTFTSCHRAPEDDRPARIDAVSGDHQSGVPGQTLVEPLIVRVLGQRSRDVFRRNKGPRLPIANRTVIFELEGVSDGQKDTHAAAPPTCM